MALRRSGVRSPSPPPEKRAARKRAALRLDAHRMLRICARVIRMDRSSEATMIPAGNAAAFLGVDLEEMTDLVRDGRLDRLTIGGHDFYWKRQVLSLRARRDWRMERLAG